MIRILVSPDPIDIAAEMTRVEDGVGAVATFTGLVRADDGVGTLELEHYPGATEAALHRLAEAATTRWSLTALVRSWLATIACRITDRSVELCWMVSTLMFMLIPLAQPY